MGNTKSVYVALGTHSEKDYNGDSVIKWIN